MKILKQIGEGRTADVFEHSDNNVLKLYKEGFPREAINQEFVINKYVYTLGVKTPQYYELIELDQRVGIVCKRVTGQSLLRVMMKRIWALNKYSRQLADLHHELHSQDVDNVVFDKQKEVLRRHIENAPLLQDEEKILIIRYLDGLQEGHKLCHGDFHPDNVLLDKEGNFWVIDWMTGMSGNPAGDVARSVILLSYGTMPEGTPKVVNTLIDFIRNRMKKAYINRYLKSSELSYSEIDQWILPVAAARLVEWLPVDEKENLLKEIKKRLEGSIIPMT